MFMFINFLWLPLMKVNRIFLRISCGLAMFHEFYLPCAGVISLFIIQTALVTDHFMYLVLQHYFTSIVFILISTSFRFLMYVRLLFIQRTLLKTTSKWLEPPLEILFYYYHMDTDEIQGFLLLRKNHIFTVRSEDTIFLFHMWRYWRAVKMLFFSFTCEDIGIVMVTVMISQ